MQRQWIDKRSPKTILFGDAKVTVIICRCPNSKQIYIPEQYQQLIPYNGIYGYDVIEKVGGLRYFKLFQDAKIQGLILKDYGFIIPLSTISHLAKKYIDYISVVHYENAEILRKHFMKNALVLHCDGTYEGDTGIHFSMRDSISGIVLYNMKIKSENEKRYSIGNKRMC